MFPRDFSIGEGETAFVNVEYLPSEVGLREARFVMVQVRQGLDCGRSPRIAAQRPFPSTRPNMHKHPREKACCKPHGRASTFRVKNGPRNPIAFETCVAEGWMPPWRGKRSKANENLWHLADTLV